MQSQWEGRSDKTKPLKFICESVPKSLLLCVSSAYLLGFWVPITYFFLMLTEKTHYYKNFFEKIWQFEQNEVFVKFWKSKLLWHSHSTDHKSERFTRDVMRQLFRKWKTGFYACLSFLRFTSVVASDNFNPSLLACFTFLREGRGRLRGMKYVPK